MVNCLGEVVALNAGGKNKAASAFYLPLERVVRALHLLQVPPCTLKVAASVQKPKQLIALQHWLSAHTGLSDLQVGMPPADMRSPGMV